jgi:putative restriction endonuclease
MTNGQPRLTKEELLEHVEEGFRSGGWNLLYLSKKREHPARYRVYRNGQAFIARVYIWNISHGGGPRSAAEYRIQITGLAGNMFEPEIGGKTVILGWWPNDEVFAGFDYRRHSGPLGGSPSMQIGLPALQAAVANRFATHLKGNGELAIAFRPDFIGTYAENLEALHDTGTLPAEVELLSRIAAAPAGVAANEIEEGIAEPRRRAIAQTSRALRALDFSERVLTAYRYQCAVCGIQLRLLDGAHILPVAEPDSTDETSNGIALCALHHRAYDRSLITFGLDHRVHLNEAQVTELRGLALVGKLRDFKSRLREIIYLPAEKTHRPKPAFVERANTLRGWRL